MKIVFLDTFFLSKSAGELTGREEETQIYQEVDHGEPELAVA